MGEVRVGETVLVDEWGALPAFSDRQPPARDRPGREPVRTAPSLVTRGSSHVRPIESRQPVRLSHPGYRSSHPPCQSTASKMPEASPMGFVVPRIGRRRLLSRAPVEGCHRAETTAFSGDLPVQDLTLRRAGPRSVWCAVRRTRGARCRTRTVSHHARRATKRTDLRRRGSDM